MVTAITESTLAKTIAVGSAFVSIFLLTSPVTDPVNATKLFALGMISTGAIAVTLFYSGKKMIKTHIWAYLFCTFFIIASLNSVLNSPSSLSQNLYGDYGRNTGFVAYLMLCFVLLATASLQRGNSLSLVVGGLLVAGGLNVIYCGWALLFGDFLGWDNPYGEILGTFGNPNFIGAFLGIFAATSFAILFSKNTSTLKRTVLTILILIAAIEIQMSKAVQGVVVALGGITIVGFYLIRARFKNWKLTTGYSASVLVIGILSVLGTLQVGPLASVVYKVSVSLRGEYWAAAARMGLDHPFTGVGMDSFGDWYRRMRDSGAMILPGPDVVTNAAHNVVLDMFAYGGFPLLISYVAIFLLGAISIIKVTLRSNEYDATFVALTVIFICYQVQSIISINQIGIAIWGWVSCGSLLAYAKSTINNSAAEGLEKTDRRVNRKQRESNVQNFVSPPLIAGLGMMAGALMAVPPLAADMKWRAALVSQEAARVEAALVPSYMNPLNSFRYSSAVQLFEQSNLPEKSHYYALKGVKFNPENYDSWRMLYLIKASTPDERLKALEEMKRLDPLNRNVASTE
jgi:O-antigen ligase